MKQSAAFFITCITVTNQISINDHKRVWVEKQRAKPTLRAFVMFAILYAIPNLFIDSHLVIWRKFTWFWNSFFFSKLHTTRGSKMSWGVGGTSIVVLTQKY